jgi:type 2 lantibiotic biosynthesis protein LanM
MLAAAAARCFMFEFDIYRRLRTSYLQAGDRLYQTFVSKTLDEGFDSIFRTYPLLPEYLSRLTLNWRRFSDSVHRHIGLSSAPVGLCGSVDVSVTSSDPHRGGRVVLLFSDGDDAWYYKPRPVDADEAFFQVVDRARQAGVEVAPCPEVRAAKDHGWIRAVRPPPMADAGYWRRAGGLLLLAHVCSLTDCHFENVVASQSGPMVIDAETPLNFGEASGGPAIRETVLSTGLLPLPEWSPDRKPADASGLGPGPRFARGSRIVAWRDVNTDRMRTERAAPSSDEHPDDHPTYQLEDLLSGFTSAYEIVMRDAAFPNFVERAFAGTMPRLLGRSTAEYSSLLRQLTSPEAFREQNSRQSVLNRLKNAAPDRDPDGQLLSLERRAIDAGDVPVWQVSASGTSVFCDGLEVRDVLAESPLTALSKRVRGLSPHDLRNQVAAIRASSYAAEAGISIDVDGSSTIDDALQLVCDRLVATAMASVDGPRWLEIGNRVDYPPLGFWEGPLGPALLLACHWQSGRGESTHGSVALAIARAAISRLGPRTFSVSDGPALWALNVIAHALADSSLRSALAERVSGLDVPAQSRPCLDIHRGLAGLALGLLNVEGPTDRVRRLYLDLCRATERRNAEQPHTPSGFAHGGAGIAAALGALARACGDDALPTAASIALARDLAGRDEDKPGKTNPREADGIDIGAAAWCRGNAGFALARLCIDPQDGAAPATLQAAQHLANTKGRSDDSLCCGVSGQADVLLEAGRRLHSASLLAESQRITQELASKLLARQCVLGDGLAGPGTRPTIAYGVVGVAYVLLRTQTPSVPCALALGALPEAAEEARASTTAMRRTVVGHPTGAQQRSTTTR